MDVKTHWGKICAYGFRYSRYVYDENAYDELQKIKGKIGYKSPENAWGLRGILLQKKLGQLAMENPSILSNKNYWTTIGNFIHIPDNSEEARQIIDYITKNDRIDKPQIIYSDIIS